MKVPKSIKDKVTELFVLRNLTNKVERDIYKWLEKKNIDYDTKEFREIIGSELAYGEISDGQEFEVKLNEFLGETPPVYKSETNQNEIKWTYGWLDPKGTFYEKDWNHEDYAKELIEQNNWKSELKQYIRELIYKHEHPDIQLSYAGHFLIHKKGWILLHSPGRSKSEVRSAEIIKSTKAQKKFLYSYFCDRGDFKTGEQYLND